ncbi:MAG: hypothetical protein KAR20_13775 [Candidatus Heimdallarchaeota archaeon]|nr:hypothetical protein [Candidatus Heimdallarchaeota archaeon]
MKAPDEKPDVKLSGTDGNAFAILGKVSAALRRAGADKKYIDLYHEKAMSGDYDNLLVVTTEYVNVS